MLFRNTRRSYDGDWVDGQMHGFGTYRFADGTTYEGVMRDNWPEGEGTARYSDGGVYVGRWKAGKCEVIRESLSAKCRTTALVGMHCSVVKVYRGGWRRVHCFKVARVKALLHPPRSTARRLIYLE